MSKHPYTLVEISGRDPDDWPELTPENGARFEKQLREAQEDDLVDGIDLDGEHFFVHKRDVRHVSRWD
jgi:hypothetical protein